LDRGFDTAVEFTPLSFRPFRRPFFWQAPVCRLEVFVGILAAFKFLSCGVVVFFFPLLKRAPPSLTQSFAETALPDPIQASGNSARHLVAYCQLPIRRPEVGLVE